MKYCGGCSTEKDESEFSKNKWSVDGLQTQCKECFKDYKRLNKLRRNERDRNIWGNDLQSSLKIKKVTAFKNLVYKFKNGKMTESNAFVEMVGCTWEEYKKYIEAQWQTGMTWENHSLTGWHIDHILPVASFDFFNEHEIKKALHYINTQPLWAIDNLKKGASLDG